MNAEARITSFGTIQLVWSDITDNWTKNRCSSMAAAIAYRSLFSLIPLVYLLALVSKVSSQLVRLLAMSRGSEVLYEIVSGLDVGKVDVGLMELVSSIVEQQLIANVVAVVVGVLVIVIGATGVFRELILSVNAIWGTKKPVGVRYVLTQRLLAFGLLAILGLLAVFSVVVRALLWTVDDLLLSYVPVSHGLSHWLGWLIVPLLTFLIVAMINKMIPLINLTWKDVVVGSVVITPLLLLGQGILGWYLGRFNPGAQFGSFGAFVAFMIWVYYSSIIILMSVQVTKIFAERWGSLKKRYK